MLPDYLMCYTAALGEKTFSDRTTWPKRMWQLYPLTIEMDVFSLTRKTSEVRLSRVRMPGRLDFNTGSPTAFQSQPNHDSNEYFSQEYPREVSQVRPRGLRRWQSSVESHLFTQLKESFQGTSYHNFLYLLIDQASDSEVHGFHWEILENFQRPSRYGSKGIPLPNHNWSGSQGRSHIALLLLLWRGGAVANRLRVF